jgi:hypothetical protein
VRTNSILDTDSTSRNRKDLALARRLITIAVTNFLCWFPISVLGLMSSNGFPVPGEANVATAINPFLYTLNLVLERHAKRREERLKQSLLAIINLQSDHAHKDVMGSLGSCSSEEAWTIFTTWMNQGVLSRDQALDVVDSVAPLEAP